MSRNRVEELEATVAELQSTVEGLTEELVESKERIRVLEAELDTESPTRVPSRRGEDTEEAEPDDVAEAAAEADKGDEPQEEDEADESGADDIIVA